MASNLELFRESAGQFKGCQCCGRDLDGLCPRAVYCPDCGKKLPALWRNGGRASAAGGLVRFLTGRFRARSDLAADTAASGACTPILTGYGRALFGLGWRYEKGNSRNLPEAIRCYRKSARLGNPDAMTRLAPPNSVEPMRVVDIE